MTRLLRMIALGAILAVLSGVRPTASAEVTCPSRMGDALLERAGVFDGPPDEQADLVPDKIDAHAGRTRSEWKLGYLYDLNRRVFVTCWYTGLAAPRIIEAAKRIGSCVLRQDPRQPATFSCR